MTASPVTIKPPTRLQASRRKGGNPPNTFVVTRASRFGNPFRVTDTITQAEAVRLFRRWLSGDDPCPPELVARRARILSDLPMIRGKNLACACKPGTPCHGDVLLTLANP